MKNLNKFIKFQSILISFYLCISIFYQQFAYAMIDNKYINPIQLNSYPSESDAVITYEPVYITYTNEDVRLIADFFTAYIM